VQSRLYGIRFRSDFEIPLFPLGLSREGFLFAAQVEPRRVHLIVAALLEDVEGFGAIVEALETSAWAVFWADNHETKDDAEIACLGHFCYYLVLIALVFIYM